MLRSSTPGGPPDTPRPSQLRLLSAGSRRSGPSDLQQEHRHQTSWPPDAGPGAALATGHRCEADAQAGRSVFGDVAEPGWFAALASARSGNTLEVLALVEGLLIAFPIQH